MADFKRVLVTSALPYANGPIHLGHFAGAYLPADIYVRYQRLKGRDVLFVSGTDEYGTAITETARREGTTPQAVADRYNAVIADAFQRVGMSFDNFSRTSLDVHRRQTQDFFQRVHAKGMFREKTEQQLYDPAAGQFLADRQVVGTCYHCGYERSAGDQCEKCGKAIDPICLHNPRSVLTGATPEVRETRHWYFPMGEWQPRLEEWLATKEHWKSNVVNFCRNYFQEGLQDRAITRDLDWGIPVPLAGWEGKVLYVWFDAPIGYVSSSIEWAEKRGEPERWRDYWCDSEGTKLVHFIGKDNIFFHALLFPALCMARGEYVVPAEVPANEFLNLEGDKFSTSRNWAVWMHECLDRFPADPLRYYLTVIMPELSDSDFQWRGFQERNNAELADTLGNFVQRSVSFVHRYFGGTVPSADALNDDDRALLARVETTAVEVGVLLEEFSFKKAVKTLMELPQAANIYFQAQAPWQTRKSDPARCAATMNTCVQVCRGLAVLMAPFMPFSAERLWQTLEQEGSVHAANWDKIGSGRVAAGQILRAPEILFPKIEDDVIEAEIARLGAPAAASATVPATASLERKTMTESPQTAVTAPAAPTPETDLISIDEFARVELRIADILEAEPVAGADKLMKLQIRIGDERRQIVAGIALKYSPADLISRQIVVVANLKPAKLRGEVSQGMLLAASADDEIVLLTPEKPIPSGAKVR